MKVIAFITDYVMLDRIIRYLNVTFVGERCLLSHVVSQQLFLYSEAWADYFS